MADKRLSSPILANMGKKSMLNLIPFTCARREMAHTQLKASLVGKFLEFNLPQSDSRTIAASPISRNQQLMSFWIHFPSHAIPPTANTFYSKCCRTMIGTDVNPSGTLGLIIDTIRSCFAKGRNHKIMNTKNMETGALPALMKQLETESDEFVEVVKMSILKADEH
jgi:hypothetical protein